MVSPDSHGIARVPWYSGYRFESDPLSVTRLSRSLALHSEQLHLAFGLVTLLTRSYNPVPQAGRFGLFRFRSPLLSESRLIYFPPGTEMVHFPGLAHTRLCIQRAVAGGWSAGWVSPFGHLRVRACLRLSGAFRSLPRPSSPVGAKASAVRPL